MSVSGRQKCTIMGIDGMRQEQKKEQREKAEERVTHYLLRYLLYHVGGKAFNSVETELRASHHRMRLQYHAELRWIAQLGESGRAHRCHPRLQLIPLVLPFAPVASPGLGSYALHYCLPSACNRHRTGEMLLC